MALRQQRQKQIDRTTLCFCLSFFPAPRILAKTARISVNFSGCESARLRSSAGSAARCKDDVRPLRERRILRRHRARQQDGECKENLIHDVAFIF